MVVHTALAPDHLSGCAEAVGRSQCMQGPCLTAAFRAATEALPSEAVKDRDDLWRKCTDLLGAERNILHDRIRVAVGQVQDTVLRDIRAHIQSAVIMTGERVAQEDPILMAHGKGELQRVIEKVLVIRNAQVVMIDLISGYAVQLVQNFSFRPRYSQRGAQRSPAYNAGVHDVEILAAHHRQYDAVGIGCLTLLKDISRKEIVSESPAAPNRNLLGDFFLEYGTDLADRYGIDLSDVKLKIQRDEDWLRSPVTGRTDQKTIGRIDLMPNAFRDEETLIRTLVHEKVHVKQLQRYGADYVSEHLDAMETEAYDEEDAWIDKNWKGGRT